jgi:hypothetical protein
LKKKEKKQKFQLTFVCLERASQELLIPTCVRVGEPKEHKTQVEIKNESE